MDDRKSCMHCMHQKASYACYAKTQLRKRLHTMHTSEHEHIKKRKREQFLFLLLLYIVCSSIFYCSRLTATKPYCSRLRALTKLIEPHCLFFYLSLSAIYRRSSFLCSRLQACMTPPDSPPRPRKKRPTSKGGAFRVTGRNQAVWRPRVGWRRPKPASVMPMQASAMTASMAPPTSRPVRARLGR